jgi:hypothetical protein
MNLKPLSWPFWAKAAGIGVVVLLAASGVTFLALKTSPVASRPASNQSPVSASGAAAHPLRPRA